MKKSIRFIALLLVVALGVISLNTVVTAQENNEKINVLLEEIAELEKEAEAKRKELRSLAFALNNDESEFIVIGEDVTRPSEVYDQVVILEQISMDRSEEYPSLIEIYCFKNISDKTIEFYIAESSVVFSRKLETIDNDSGHYVWNETEYVVPDGKGFVKSNAEPKEVLPQQEVYFRVISKIEEPLGVYYLADRNGYWKVAVHNTPEFFGEFIRQ